MKVRYVVGFLFVLIFSAKVGAVSVSNSGFERGTGARLAGWTSLDDTLSAVFDASVKYKGKASGRIQIVSPKQIFGMHSEAVRVEENTTYVLRAFTKVESGSARRAFLKVLWLDEGLVPMRWATDQTAWAAEDTWVQVAGTVHSPAGAQFAQILCVAEDWGGAI